MKLASITRKYPIKIIKGSTELNIQGLEHNSKKVSSNNLFIAQKGFTHDGHEYIEDAINKGAIAIIQEKNVGLDKEVTIIKVRDSLDALGYFAGNYYELPWKMMDIIGITGTNGKTSVSYYIDNILKENQDKTGILGTMGAVINNNHIDLLNTTPDSLEIQRILNEMIKENIKFCIMEVSSHALDLKRVKYMDFDIGIFTNLSEEHLDFHETMDNYFKSKVKLFYKTRKYNIINIDDPYGKKIIDLVKDRVPIITYGYKNPGLIMATNIEYGLNDVKFNLITPNGHRDIKLSTPGEFSLYNALAAAACAYGLQLNLDIIKRGLESLPSVRGRFELVHNNKGFNIIIDFAHTPKALEEVLKTISRFNKGKIIVVVGAGGNRDISKRPEMGKIVGKYADLSIITSDNPRFENPEMIINDIIDGVKKTKGKYVKIVDRKEAIEYAINKAKPNDTVLLAGKGHEEHMIIENKPYPFNEREIVKKIINKI